MVKYTVICHFNDGTHRIFHTRKNGIVEVLTEAMNNSPEVRGYDVYGGNHKNGYQCIHSVHRNRMGFVK